MWITRSEVGNQAESVDGRGHQGEERKSGESGTTTSDGGACTYQSRSPKLTEPRVGYILT